MCNHDDVWIEFPLFNALFVGKSIIKYNINVIIRNEIYTQKIKCKLLLFHNEN